MEGDLKDKWERGATGEEGREWEAEISDTGHRVHRPRACSLSDPDKASMARTLGGAGGGA